MSVIVQESVAEGRAITAIRTELQTRIESGQLSVDDVANRLGLLPVGVESLLLRDWSFEEAFRVATALGLDFAAALKS